MRTYKEKRWVGDGWDVEKFNRYLNFHKHWNHNFIRIWMWEHGGDTEAIWEKDTNGKYDLSRLNQAYFDRMRSIIAAAESRDMYYTVMFFQGWSGTCDASAADWPYHPMHRDNNINGIDGDPDGTGYGARVHWQENPGLVRIHETYVKKLIDTLNDFDNLIWEIGNETIRSSIPFKAHIVQFIRDYESGKSKQHLILDGAREGADNPSIWITNPDIYTPCALKRWGSHEEPYFTDPPVADEALRKVSILDNDHTGNHFLRFTALDQRSWTWKAFTRGHHPVHMDCYDVFWDKARPTPDHPVPGVATNPHYDSQRKSMGDVLRFAEKMDIAAMLPVRIPAICSTTFCLMNKGREYLAYQPETNGAIMLELPKGVYEIESFDTMDNSVKTEKLEWDGGEKDFPKPGHVSEDWVLHVRSIEDR